MGSLVNQLYGSLIPLQQYMSAQTVKTLLLTMNTTRAKSSRLLEITLSGQSAKETLADIEFQGKISRIRLTQVLHVPGTDGKVLSLKVLDQKGFESQKKGGQVRIMKDAEVYVELHWAGSCTKYK